MREEQLRQLLDFPNETLEAEYKSWPDLGADRDRAALARHIAAIANHGGGYVVFGFEDSDLSPTPDNTDLRSKITRDSVSGIVKRYLEPPFQCEVAIVRSTAGNLHPVVIVPPHGVAPICAKAGGPEQNGKPAGLAKGAYYIRKPGPASDTIQSAAEWAPLIRRCTMHDRASLLAAINGAISGRSSQPAEALLGWHSAATAAFKSALPTPQDSLALNYRQLSYEIVCDDERLSHTELRDAVREVNNEVRDLVQTGWSMFYPFDRRDYIHWASDPLSGEGDDDFLQLSLVGELASAGRDFWRLARSGKASLVREYWEDDPGVLARRKIDVGTTINPDLQAKQLAEFVRHARGLAERFRTASHVRFRCEWHGLAGRHAVDFSDYGRLSGVTSKTDHRVAAGEWPVGDLTIGWPQVVSTLAAPLARAFDIERHFYPEVLIERSASWRRL